MNRFLAGAAVAFLVMGVATVAALGGVIANIKKYDDEYEEGDEDMTLLNPIDRWESEDTTAVTITGGPERVYDEDPKPSPSYRVGFGVPLTSREREPLVWDGDNS